ncbi:universal stress protein [Jeongeupia naejangsanensis]|uniref:Universal stress protein n=1 Tax=Jeongeupia naejangsanensis TaxID=613195 RepID=A0ABS2BH32_9NEIS|nr:universal stress protein [Jeongeupia naejangsanensis]MBM3114398.1 universal stress protein [Jeongeupia naejangsanensis]
MTTILVPVDGSRPSMNAVQAVLDFADHQPFDRLVLLNVQVPIVRGRSFMNDGDVLAIYKAEAERAFDGACSALEAKGVQFEVCARPGPVAETIVLVAEEIGADHIYMGTRGYGAAVSAMLGSVAGKVVSLSDLPVTLVN